MSAPPFGFLDLPGEIRNQIYGHCLLFKDGPVKLVLKSPPLGEFLGKFIHMCSFGDRVENYFRFLEDNRVTLKADDCVHNCNYFNPLLIQICRQLYAEGKQFLYGMNEFSFPYFFLFQNFVRTSTRETRNLVQKIQVSFPFAGQIQIHLTLSANSEFGLKMGATKFSGPSETCTPSLSPMIKTYQETTWNLNGFKLSQLWLGTTSFFKLTLSLSQTGQIRGGDPSSQTRLMSC